MSEKKIEEEFLAMALDDEKLKKESQKLDEELKQIKEQMEMDEKKIPADQLNEYQKKGNMAADASASASVANNHHEAEAATVNLEGNNATEKDGIEDGEGDEDTDDYEEEENEEENEDGNEDGNEDESEDSDIIGDEEEEEVMSN